jgi:hypothetical protein
VPSKVPTTNPTGAFPEDSFKYSPLEHVRTLFVGFFQGLFHAAPVGAYHWEYEDDQTEIYISNENVLKAENIGQRPAISATRGPLQFYSLGLDDMLAYDFQTGTKRKSVLVPGTMVINCSSREPIECERIAWICAEQLWLHREMLMAAGFFEIGRQPAIGSPSPAGSIIAADGGDEWYVTPVTCPFQFYRTSQFSPLGKKIVKEIGVSIRARLQDVYHQNVTSNGHGGPPATPNADVPVSIREFRPPPFAPHASDVYGNTPSPGSPPTTLPLVPHPHNPAQLVVVRSSRPNSPAVRPAGMGGRSIPIAEPYVEESSESRKDRHVTRTSRFKV